MTTLVWDEVGARQYEAGVDRGVLYSPDGWVSPWNGLTSISENRAREVKEYYLDGYKYLEQHIADTFSARLQAYTYPERLEELLGLAAQAPGVLLHDQPTKAFGLSYRTGVGNDSLGMGHGYKLHVLYNVRAVPSATTHNTLSGGFNATMLEWNLSGVPLILSDGRSPTNHISFDSRTMDPEVLQSVEDTLYGTASAAPVLPSLSDLLELAT